MFVCVIYFLQLAGGGKEGQSVGFAKSSAHGPGPGELHAADFLPWAEPCGLSAGPPGAGISPGPRAASLFVLSADPHAGSLWTFLELGPVFGELLGTGKE